MKHLAIILLFSLCVAGRAGSLITATITVTNTPADGDTITVNGSARTWKNTVATPASQITIGASIGANATNLFNQVAGTPFTTLTLNRSGTNGITLRGVVDQTITVSIAGTWGTYVLSTNTTTDAQHLLVPGSAHPTQSKQTNIVSQVALDLGTYSTNKLANGTKFLEGVVQTNQTQTVNGNKTFTGVNVYSNATQQIVGGTLTNVTLGATNIYATNAHFRTITQSNAAPSIIIYDTGGAADEKNTTIYSSGGFLNIRAYTDAGVAGDFALYIERNGSAIQYIVMPNGEVLLGGGDAGDGIQIAGTTKYIPVRNTTLANGNNAGVTFAGTTFVKINAGPTAAFAICGIVNDAPNSTDGRMLTIYNATGQNMTIANDSGVDPTPANRIYTNTGGDIATTGNGAVTLIYDDESSRWIVTSFRD